MSVISKSTLRIIAMGVAAAIGAAAGYRSLAPIPKWVSAYYVGYQRDLYPPEAIDFSSITHLIVGRVVPGIDGSLDLSFDLDEKEGPEMARDLARRAHAAGKKALLMIGGEGSREDFAPAASAANRGRFVAELAKATKDLGFDGVDLDWEPLDPADYPDFKALVTELRRAMPDALLTFPVKFINSNRREVDSIYAEVAPLLDQINIMSYGMAGNWGAWQSWHHSALTGETPQTPTSVDSSIRAYLQAGVPAKKLGIGIGFYGSCWNGSLRPVTGPRVDLSLPQFRAAQVLESDEWLSYRNIMTHYYSPSAYVWDPVAQAAYLSSATGLGSGTLFPTCHFISYDDARAVQAKGRYVQSMGLGGTILWTLNQGDAQNQLLRAVGQAFSIQ